VQHAFRSAQGIRQALKLSGTPSNNGHLKAVVVVQVHVGGGQNVGVVLMLDSEQLFVEPWCVVVIKEHNRADCFPVPLPGALHQKVANKVSDELGAVRVARIPP